MSPQHLHPQTTLGLGVLGLGLRVLGEWFRVLGFGFCVWVLDLGIGFWI